MEVGATFLSRNTRVRSLLSKAASVTPAAAFILTVALALTLPPIAPLAVAAQTSCGVQPLTSSTLQGSWTSDCPSQYRENAYARFYTFTLIEESEVTITLDSATDPYLFLLTGSGEDAEYLTENDDIDRDRGNFNSRIAATLERGDYTIEATTYEAEATGDFILTVAGIDFAEQLDRTALVAFYNATGGDDWKENDNWLTDAPLDDWHGVETDDSGRVTALDLNFNDLTGPLLPELGNLHQLQVLTLQANNSLTGTIPPQLGNLTNLRELRLNDCKLTGEIPPELGNLVNLQELSLHTNRLSGQIPPELSNLANLRELSLGGNQLTGTIPIELSRLSNLSSLYLGGNQLTGEIPPQLGDIKTLEFIFLWQNDLTGQIPPELGKLTNLGGLDLHGNNLTGEVPTELGNLVSLWHILDLSGNRLTGRLPHSLTDIDDLFNFSFDDNAGLCAPNDAVFQEWLKSIPQHRGDMCGTPPPDPLEIAALTALYHATNGNNWTNNTNWLTDAPLSEWHGVLTNADGRVEELMLDDNQLSGTIPPELGELDSLRGVFFDNNQLSGSIPPELSRPNYLVYVELAGNQLTGTIPPELGDATFLRVLDLRHNELTGAIPPELEKLEDLRTLSLHDNQLTGAIPSELARLDNLENLLLQYNQLTGQISS